MYNKALLGMVIICWCLFAICTYFLYTQNTYVANLSLNIGKVGHFTPNSESPHSQIELVPEIVELLKIKFPNQNHDDPRLVETYSNNLHHVFGSILNLRVEGTDKPSVNRLSNEILKWLLTRHERLYQQNLALITVYNPIDPSGIVYRINESPKPGRIGSRTTQKLREPILENFSYSTTNWLMDRYLLSPINSKPTEVIHNISISDKNDPRKLILSIGTLSLIFTLAAVYLDKLFR